ncbi:endonuclease domain-containing protein [Nitrosococcus wardiae]|uniref:Endonuclease domain-containing protein n=2 Tax=Nitrosococcus wardiae TaxID=1814290 RepID=A0A4V1AWH2_9GAMM|nr:endonuclease domain-containing protein [Nitrosococcus wardiae]
MSHRTRISSLVKQRVRELRREPSEAERQLWQHLRRRQLGGYRFRRQHPLGHYVVDFVCLEAQLVIEVDGGQHSEQQDYDQWRTEWLTQRGFRVLRFWNHEVLSSTEAVITAIWYALHGDTLPPSPPSP